MSLFFNQCLVQNYQMLHFLEERQDFHPRNSFRSKPQIGFGISVENPTTQRSQYSMVSPATYPNSFEHQPSLPSNPKPNSDHVPLSPSSWLHKTDINQIQEAKIIGSGDLTSRPGRYHETYQLELQKNSSRFKLTNGEFRNYIEKVRATNQVFGPLSGQERSPEKSLETKKSLIRQSQLHLEKSKQKLQLDRSLRKESSRILQKLIDERRVLREKRDKFYYSYKKQLTERKSPRHDYTLPRILVNRDSKPLGKAKDFGIFKTIDTSTLSHFIK